MKLFYHPEGRLRLETDNRCVLEVKPVWASPLSNPRRFLALVDGQGKEVCMFVEPEDELSPENWELLKKELDHRYLNGQIHKILEATTEYGSTYWTVETECGIREFVTQSLQENAQWLRPNYLLVIDVDGNRFEIPDVAGLDPHSRKLLAETV